MTALDVDTVLDASSLTDIDFEPALPCEYRKHDVLTPLDEPAAWLLDSLCPACGDGKRITMCEPCRMVLMQPSVAGECPCGHIVERWSEFVLNIRPIEQMT